MEDHADRQRSLDGDVRIGALAAGFAAGYPAPALERLIRKPDSQITTLLQASLVLGPIPHPILKFRVLVLAPLQVLDRWRLRLGGIRSPSGNEAPSHAPTPPTRAISGSMADVSFARNCPIIYVAGP